MKLSIILVLFSFYTEFAFTKDFTSVLQEFGCTIGLITDKRDPRSLINLWNARDNMNYLTFTYDNVDQVGTHSFQRHSVWNVDRFIGTGCKILVFEIIKNPSITTAFQLTTFLISKTSRVTYVVLVSNLKQSKFRNFVVQTQPIINYYYDSGDIFVSCTCLQMKFKSLQKFLDMEKKCETCSSKIEGHLEFKSIGHLRTSTALRSNGCGSSDRKIFFNSLGFCQNGYIFGFMISARSLNTSFSAEEVKLGSKTEDKDILQIYWLPVMGFEKRISNDFIHSQMKVLVQSKTIIMYCSKISGEISEKLEGHASLVPFEIWVAIIIIFLVISFIHHNIMYGIDFLWLLIGNSITKARHFKQLLVVLYLGSLFLNCIYSAEYSSENLSAKLPTSLKDLASKGYQFHMPLGTLLALQFATPLSFRTAFSSAFGVSDISKMLSVEGNSAKENGKTLAEKLERLVDLKVLGIASRGNQLFRSSAFLVKVLSLADKVIISNKFLCGSIPISEKVSSHFILGYISWGRRSKKFNEYFNRLDEMGIIGRLQDLISEMEYQMDKTSWSPLMTKLRIPSPLPLKSPLGIAALLQIAACLGIFLCWSVIKFLNGVSDWRIFLTSITIVPTRMVSTIVSLARHCSDFWSNLKRNGVVKFQ